MSVIKTKFIVKDKTDKVIEQTVVENNLTGSVTAKQIKDDVNKGKYTNIDTETLQSTNVTYNDIDVINSPFLIYNIKLK